MPEDTSPQPDSALKPVELTEAQTTAPTEAAPRTESVASPSPAAPTEEKPQPVENMPVTPNIPASPPPIISSPDIRALKSKAVEAVQARRKDKLEKIITLTKERGSITNDEVEKLLHVSDATATRYLAELVKQGRLRRTGARASSRYEPVK